MSTGACGINCDVCRLNRAGVCSTCGPGTSPEAAAKLAAQERLLGAPCAILACARLNHIQYCLRDCRDYPWENFQTGPYPFSKGFLDMQERRRKEPPPARTPTGEAVRIPKEYWEDLAREDPQAICRNALADRGDDGRFRLPFLTRILEIDPFEEYRYLGCRIDIGDCFRTINAIFLGYQAHFARFNDILDIGRQRSDPQFIDLIKFFGIGEGGTGHPGQLVI